ncbi:pentapeptide repeat-containing protein [Gleimia sp. 6138-11-ORH1]|uniref:pentapeptide repeat-containing protein n=1 Tax=Gleimia sp. 6138-11-ORH1 TaxID=2973937 RepID=UPI0021699F34|nr:pentapeptide repeat-containing protein [Gleimia sp. 6138-11-ORH1]MCS4483921.1 pentapeptide repeat-containing protein [Gleimia sp. 6138-11-ORH1]
MERSDKRMPLLLTIFIWVMFSVSLVWSVFVFLWFLSSIDKDTGAKPLVGIVTASLTSVGGIGAVAYLVMKYRERLDKEVELEHSRIAEADRKLKEAVGQLGSESPQVRLAGVYGLADVADNYLGRYKQRVVDILCGYLRTDRSELVVDGKFKDAAVESAIIKVIGERLRKNRVLVEDIEVVQTVGDEQLWCDCSFDFTGATFHETVSWERTLWDKAVVFTDTTFKSDVVFEMASFAGDARFDRVIFTGGAWFNWASFTAYAWFSGASFAGDFEFYGVRFAGVAVFDGVRFAGEARFVGARFAGNAWFEETTFFDGLNIENTVFEYAPETKKILLPNPNLLNVLNSEEWTMIEDKDYWTIDDHNKHWTLERQKERIENVYKDLEEALKDHPREKEKLKVIRETIGNNFPKVQVDFDSLDTEA